MNQNGVSLTGDQRGPAFSRFVGPFEFVDIGAVEAPFLPIGVDLIVDSTADGIDGDLSAGEFTLREAITIANSQGGAEVITIDSSLSGSTITLNEGELFISEDVSIHGPSGHVTIDAQQNSRVIRASSAVGNLVLDSLTITGGLTAGLAQNGGGILFEGPSGSTLDITNTEISNNRTTGISAFGGGIHLLSGDLVLTDSLVSGNSVSGVLSEGGAVSAADGSVTLVNTTLHGNVSSQSAGGIFLDTADLSLTNSTVAGNTAANSGGGFSFEPGGNVEIFNSIVAGLSLIHI